MKKSKIKNQKQKLKKKIKNQKGFNLFIANI